MKKNLEIRQTFLAHIFPLKTSFALSFVNISIVNRGNFVSYLIKSLISYFSWYSMRKKKIVD